MKTGLILGLIFFYSAGILANSELIYSTYLGGMGEDYGRGIAVDSAGNAYLTGYTRSPDFPTTFFGFDTTFNGSTSYYDIFIAKLNSTGSDLIYCTYLGGENDDYTMDMDLDDSGNVYITGHTESADFPITHSIGTSGGTDIFAIKINDSGTSLLYSICFGGSDYDRSYGIEVDDSGNAYLTGYTNSSDFPVTPGAFDISYNGWEDVFIAKLNHSGTDLIYSSYLGGKAYDYGHSLAVDRSGNAYLTGYTDSPDFPVTPGAFDTTFNNLIIRSDVFVTKLNSSGSDLVYSTYLGGQNFDYGENIAIDGTGCVYITGGTLSVDFPTTSNALDISHNDGYDAFLTKLNAGGTGLIYSTYLGGVGEDYGYGLAVDAMCNAYITGYTNSPNFPITYGAIDTSYDSGYGDVFITKINASGSVLIYSTYLGDWYYEQGNDITFDNMGDIYLIGETGTPIDGTPDFPVTSNAFDTSYNGGYYDIFIVKLSIRVLSIPMEIWEKDLE